MAQTTQMLHHTYNCLNVKKPFARACKICADSCPHRAISDFREIEASSCTECGVCMAACPSDGFVDRRMDDLRDYLLSEPVISLSCPQAAPAGWEIPCLGMLGRDLWLTLMVYAKDKPVTVQTGICGTCPDKGACAVSVQTFKGIHEEWPDHPPVKIIVKPYGTETGDQGLSAAGEMTPAEQQPAAGSRRPETGRAEQLRNWRKLGRRRLEGLLPGLVADEAYNVPRARQWLVEALATRPEAAVPFQALIVGDSCTSCGVCAAICPQGALFKRQKGEGVQLVLEPVNCVQCGRCVEICQTSALSFAAKPLNHRLLTGKILLHEGRARFCSVCGKQIFDNTEPPLCMACATSDPGAQNFLL